MGDYYHNGGSLNNWMFNTDATGTWFLSPSADYAYIVLYLENVGDVCNYGYDGSGASRPVLNLKSDVMTIGGDGSYSSPYILK